MLGCGSKKPTVTQPDLVDEDDEYEVEEILARRTHRNRTEWLVRWAGYGPADDQWLRKALKDVGI